MSDANLLAIETALAELAPIQRRDRWVAAGIVVALLPIAIHIGMLIIDYDGRGWAMLPAVAYMAVLFKIPKYYRQKHERVFLPILAPLIDLEFTKNPGKLRGVFPQSFLTKQAPGVSEDRIDGMIGDRRFSAVEMRIVAEGPKLNRLYFRGLVIWLSHARGGLDISLARHELTEKPLLGDAILDTDGMVCFASVKAQGSVFDIWCPRSQRTNVPIVQSYGEALLAAANDADIYSAARDGLHTYLALNTTRNRFIFGGLFTTKAKLRTQIQAALADMHGVLDIALGMIKAETALMGDTFRPDPR